MLHLHSLVATKKSPLAIIEKSLIRDNCVYSTNLEYWLKTNSINAENGIYSIINGKLFKDTSEIDDFPSLDLTESFYSFTSNESLIELLKDLINYASKDDMRPAMTGVYFDSSENSLVATNGHILRQVPFELPKGSSFIVPMTSIKKLIQIIAKMKVKTYQIGISLHKDSDKYPYIKFKLNGIEFISRVIDEKFPQYQSVVPLDFQTLYTFRTNELLNNTKELKLFVSPVTKQVVIDFSQGDISAYNQDTDIKESLHIDMNVKSFNQSLKSNNFSLLMPTRLDNPSDYKVGFSRDYLEIVLKSHSSEFISFYYNTNTKAVLIVS